jgi:murein DD-endopeptidase MepM/ murein hydrolase activator NlpD
MRMHPILKIERMHAGEDFATEEGTPVKATANGIVVKTDFSKTAGNLVVIDHGNEFSTLYSQMTNYIVKEGQTVEKGDIIGYVGSTGLSTGPHLHYEVMKEGEYVDPQDYLGKTKE